MEPPPAPTVYLQVACYTLLSLQKCLNADFIYLKISLDEGREAPILPNLHSPTCPWITCNDAGGISMETDVSFSQKFSVATRSGSFVSYIIPQEAVLSYLREFIFTHRHKLFEIRFILLILNLVSQHLFQRLGYHKFLVNILLNVLMNLLLNKKM